MADGEHRLLERVELTHEAMHLAVGADAVRRTPAGDEYGVKILSGAIGDQLLGPKACAVVEAALPADALARPLVHPDDSYDRAGLFESPARLGKVNFFEAVAN